MGGCVNKQQRDENDKMIQKELKDAAREERNIFKMLLLGTGESGKSTIFKQMIKLHGGGLSRHRLEGLQDGVKRNALESIINLVKNSRAFVEQKHDDCAISAENQPSVDYVMQFADYVDEGLQEETGPHIANIWSDPGIKNTLELRHLFEVHVIDNASYFLDKVVEIFKPDYEVTEEDAFRVRVMTTGMTEQNFDLNGNLKLKMVDVGGQRSERRKWIKWFDGIDCILFVVAVSEFDQVLFEDGKTNRFVESLSVWEEIVNKPIFARTRIILFLNKIDIFREKIQKFNIADSLPDFNGEEHNEEAALAYFEGKYLSACPQKEDDIAVYCTTATDTDIMSNILENVREAILQQLLGEGGVL